MDGPDTNEHTNGDDTIGIVISGRRLAISGDIDAATAPAIEAALTTIDGDVELELSGVDFMDSSGLRVMINCHQHREADGSTLVLVAPSPAVLRTIELTALDQLLNIRSS